PLRREAIDVYLAQRFAGLALPAGFAELVYARTEGNPLFVARLVDHLLEDGLLVVDANAGELQQTADIAEHVPPTLRATIEQRADAFTPAEREVLEAASVAGVQFWSAGVAAALGLDREEVERHCSALCRRHGFLAVHDDEGVGLPQLGGRYCFRHSLYRQALYDRIEVSRRQRWHRAIAEALRAGWQGRAGEIAAELASHFERGAAYADAIELYDRAAATAAGRGANREAVLHLDRALMLLSLSADDGNRAQRRLDILMSRGPLVLAAAGHGSQEVLDNYRPALELARQLDNSMRELACLGALAVCEQTRGNLAASEQLALAMTAVAERIGFPEPILAQLRNPLSQVRLYQGKLAEALALSDAAIAAYEVFTLPAPAADDRPALWADLGVMLYSQRAAASFASGLLRQAGEAVERAMAMARELRHPFNLAYAATWAAAYESTMGRWQEAIARADEAIDVADNYDFPFWGGVARIFRGHARAQIGYIEEGLAELRHGLDLWSGTGAKIATTMYCNLHAEACLLAGDIEGARAGLDRGAAYAEETDEHVFAAETLRLGAECRRRAGAPKKEVAAILQQALELSRQQGTRLWQLRAALDLHRLQPTAATQQAVATAAAHLQSEPIPHPLPF
ncbi:MAG TPA: hypothetical protein VEB21_00365, partial [Terriglobales bacterium]|nr:hypothetical protein [Terriglobales bacterium]